MQSTRPGKRVVVHKSSDSVGKLGNDTARPVEVTTVRTVGVDDEFADRAIGVIGGRVVREMGAQGTLRVLELTHVMGPSLGQEHSKARVDCVGHVTTGLQDQ